MTRQRPCVINLYVFSLNPYAECSSNADASIDLHQLSAWFRKRLCEVLNNCWSEINTLAEFTLPEAPHIPPKHS